MYPDEVVERFPDGCPGVGLGRPVAGILRPLHEPDLAAAGFDDAGIPDAVNSRAAGAGEDVGLTEFTVLPAVLLEPPEAEAGVGVGLAAGIREVLVEFAVDEGEGVVDRHRGSVRFKDGGVPREDPHPRPDGGLGEIDGGDRGCGHLVERFGERSLQFAEKLLAGDGRGGGGAAAADEDDGGGEGVCFSPNRSVS